MCNNSVIILDNGSWYFVNTQKDATDFIAQYNDDVDDNINVLWYNKKHYEFSTSDPMRGWTKLVRKVTCVYEDDGTRNYNRLRWTIGYILSGEADLKKFVYCFGDQNNGKTMIWTSLIEAFHLYLDTMHPRFVYCFFFIVFSCYFLL